MTLQNKPEPASPCVDICVLDPDDLCVGCYRTASEIAAWSELDGEAKERVIASTLQRRKQNGALL